MLVLLLRGSLTSWSRGLAEEPHEKASAKGSAKSSLFLERNDAMRTPGQAGDTLARKSRFREKDLSVLVEKKLKTLTEACHQKTEGVGPHW